ARTTASWSFQGTITVAAVAARVTPGLAGIAAVARPEPACASSPATGPWAAPRGRPPRAPGAGRDRRRREARAGLREQSVDVAVVRAGELEHRLAPGPRPPPPQPAHRRLGARRA